VQWKLSLHKDRELALSVLRLHRAEWCQETRLQSSHKIESFAVLTTKALEGSSCRIPFSSHQLPEPKLTVLESVGGLQPTRTAIGLKSGVVSPDLTKISKTTTASTSHKGLEWYVLQDPFQ
jgi:hypothetical protein